MNKLNSLTSYLKEHANKERASFHMPGHKGSGFFVRMGYGDAFGQGEAGIADLDITEIPGADDLRKADSVIKEVQDRYSRLYGSKRSFISVNGSSAPIMAAVISQVRRGRRLIAAADSHISVKNGIELAGAEAVYVQPETIFTGTDDRLTAPCSVFGGRENGLPGGIRAEDIAALLDEYEDADAVILPSPNYFGIVSDIKAIADEVHKRGKVLIVDQAHGAHLKMFSDAGQYAGSTMPEPAEECGADIVIDSTHKTMASFTQSAVVHIFGERVDWDRFGETLLMLESTSPSYVLMDSLAVNADIMEAHGKELAGSWRSDLDFFYSRAAEINGINVLTREAVRAASAENVSDLDETKIVIDFKESGIDGEEAERLLIEHGVFPEFHTGSVVMCLTGIGNERKDYEVLLEALRDIADR